MDEWEYKFLLCDGPHMEPTLAELGKQGWEAVGFTPVIQWASSTGTCASNTLYVTEWTAQQYRVLLKRRMV